MQSFLPLDVLGEIWDLIQSVSEGFLTYSVKFQRDMLFFVILFRFLYLPQITTFIEFFLNFIINLIFHDTEKDSTFVYYLYTYLYFDLVYGPRSSAI